MPPSLFSYYLKLEHCMTIEENSQYMPGREDVLEVAEELVAITQQRTMQHIPQSGSQIASQTNVSTALNLSVVIPTRNERDNILPLLKTLQQTLEGLCVEIIFVDDSDDDTPQTIEDVTKMLGSSLLHIQLEHRLSGNARAGGLATAVVAGIGKAQAEYVAVLDADLQHPPELLRLFYEQAGEQGVDLVLASRYIKGASYDGLADAKRRFVSVGLKWTAKIFFAEQLMRISDPLGGFFLLRRELLTNVSLRPIGYKILLELLIRCSWRSVLEVPYRFQVRTHGQSKANIQQGIHVLQHMMRLCFEVPFAGCIWKMSQLLLLNVFVGWIVFSVSKPFLVLSTGLTLVVCGVMALLDLFLVRRFIFVSPRVRGRVVSVAPPGEPVGDRDVA
jgi:dolichol-phosphate mannosyltransferase